MLITDLQDSVRTYASIKAAGGICCR